MVSIQYTSNALGFGVTGPFPDFAGNPYGRFPAKSTEGPRGSGMPQIFFIYLEKIIGALPRTRRGLRDQTVICRRIYGGKSSDMQRFARETSALAGGRIFDRNHQNNRETLSVGQLGPVRAKKKASERSKSTFVHTRTANMPRGLRPPFYIISDFFI